MLYCNLHLTEWVCSQKCLGVECIINSDPRLYYETVHELLTMCCVKTWQKSKLPHFFTIYLNYHVMYIFFTYFLKKSFTITENHWENISLLLSDTCTVFTYIRGLTYDTHSEKCFLLIVWKECRHIKHTLPPYRCCAPNTQRVCQSLYVPANQTFKKKQKNSSIPIQT